MTTKTLPQFTVLLAELKIGGYEPYFVQEDAQMIRETGKCPVDGQRQQYYGFKDHGRGSYRAFAVCVQCRGACEF
mgnify:CR=1 FL=1